MLEVARAHSKECTNWAFKYSKDRWDKGHTPSTISVGDMVMVSTVNFTNLQELGNYKAHLLELF